MEPLDWEAEDLVADDLVVDDEVIHNDLVVPPPLPSVPLTFRQRLRKWFWDRGAWWTSSFLVHAALMAVLMFIGIHVPAMLHDDAPLIEQAQVEPPTPAEELQRFESGDGMPESSNLDLEIVQLDHGPQVAQVDPLADAMAPNAGGRPNASDASQLGGLNGFAFKGSGLGPARALDSGVGGGRGTGVNPGAGGAGIGFSGRTGAAHKMALATFGGTKQSERAVGAALNWLSRHQSRDGSWSLDHTSRCKDRTCMGPGMTSSSTGATALALLPFLAAGQTHQMRGPFKATINNGVYWLLRHQRGDGDLSVVQMANPHTHMYSHSLATITLCEAYALSGDKSLAGPAQRAVNFILAAQNPQTGGWRYFPGEEGDTSVVGWCVMALKSARMAGLSVNAEALEGAKHFLASVARGQYKGLYSYLPKDERGEYDQPEPSMTAVAMLLLQYMDVPPKDPRMIEGVTNLLENLPDNENRDFYYWYYATQVLHNMPGPDWDAWNRQMRRILIGSQVREGCATGSWDPLVPIADPWAKYGGRLFVTSMATLTLEVYYRYLPLYKLDPAAPMPESILARLAKEKAERERLEQEKAAAEKNETDPMRPGAANLGAASAKIPATATSAP